MRFILFVIITFFLIFNAETRPLRVSIDPGHGGMDQGAAYGSFKESKIALSIARKLHTQLKKDPHFEVLLLRKTDKSLKLPTRLRMSRQFGSDLFISIHINAHENRTVHGSEFYIPSPNQKSSAKLRKHFSKKRNRSSTSDKTKDQKLHQTDRYVENIVSDLQQSHRTLQSFQFGSFLHKHWRQHKKRGIRQAPFYVLNKNQAPAILIEVGYLSNQKERQKLIQPQVQGAIAQRIHKALEDYAKSMGRFPGLGRSAKDSSKLENYAKSVDKFPKAVLKAGNVKIR